MVSIAAVSMLSGFSVYCKVIVWLPADPLGLKSHAQYTVGTVGSRYQYGNVLCECVDHISSDLELYTKVQ